MALALLPPQEVETAFYNIRASENNKVKQELRQLFLYFENQWLTNTPVEMWNVHGCEQRTNNTCEGFHARLNRRIQTAHSNIWSFIRCLMNEEIRFQHLYARINTGVQKRPKSSAADAIQKRIDTLNKRYENKQIDAEVDAQSERQTSIYSPPFYSSPTGYKMRVRLYLNGYGNARRTHMSLFFVLMQSEYDVILKFPFNYKVTFCLYDQTPAQRHIIDSFRPDIKSNSFQRPRSEMNIASGIPKFCPLSVIQQEDNVYVRDDTMFIKIRVNFDDMPKTLLPYALCLNPGLPLHVRQEMVEKEAKRRKKAG
ncbi:unnamed protein product [Rotaria sp. Silwood1]|nr:unnamed protein product [Rotaria sp. Silwood1]CAF4853786.1 unnamed protein product [Rotaria sp. Silwood1]